ncbi:hypothetical protein CVT25_007712 [Psilocybe cyanescens]|uniref:SCP domain-containing protein n=1 Tax=Psilocybe cyanescens TaxID=93625 RepID=A0A409XP99_PSICY|nr:hypothetical protein CVT25_007712 [Psilocybe cyanescens]
MFKFAVCLILSTFLGRVAGSEATVNLEARVASKDAWSDQVLSEHNKARGRYGAKPLQWSTSLFPPTNQYAQMCKFAHSDAQSRYGENLYASSNLNAGIADAIKSWMAEAYNHPGYNLATGHFTQVVWKDTTQVACALASCAAGTIFPIQPSKYIVCRYTPPGNYAGQFALVHPH